MACSVTAYRNRILGMIYAHRGVQSSVLKNLRVPEHIRPGTAIDEADYVVVDTELTGLKLSKDSIVSIGAVKMKGGRIGIGEIFYRLVEPATALTGESVVIHGITPSEVAEWPEIGVLLPEFIDFCNRCILIGHFVSIDLHFVNREMKRLYGFPMQNPAIDTFRIYSWLRKGRENTCAFHEGIKEDAALLTLAKKYGIHVSAAHNALDDAFVTAQLFQRFLAELPEMGVRTVGDLLRIGKP
ncbi:MAG: 3'-5' exonuclease [Thermodesulfovibrionales bacterium]